jgi:hypothetical protein
MKNNFDKVLNTWDVIAVAFGGMFMELILSIAFGVCFIIAALFYGYVTGKGYKE